MPLVFLLPIGGLEFASGWCSFVLSEKPAHRLPAPLGAAPARFRHSLIGCLQGSPSPTRSQPPFPPASIRRS